MSAEEPAVAPAGGMVLHVCLACDYFGIKSENVCPLCGTGLVHCCVECGALLANPFARYCVQCGCALRLPSTAEQTDSDAD